VYEYAALPVKQNGANQSRAVLDGLTHSRYPVEVHITKLAPGGSPHPPHSHVHEEMMLLKDGQLDVTLDGKTTRMTPGSLVFVSSGVLHGLFNPGPAAAEYFVIALGQKENG
jgi:quercetin dioxygenase-like cupin family protein